MPSIFFCFQEQADPGWPLGGLGSAPIPARQNFLDFSSQTKSVQIFRICVYLFVCDNPKGERRFIVTQKMFMNTSGRHSAWPTQLNCLPQFLWSCSLFIYETGLPSSLALEENFLKGLLFPYVPHWVENSALGHVPSLGPLPCQVEWGQDSDWSWLGREICNGSPQFICFFNIQSFISL